MFIYDSLPMYIKNEAILRVTVIMTVENTSV